VATAIHTARRRHATLDAVVDAAITTDRLTRAFPSGVAVDHVTFALGQGEVLALLGPNGAGKTTTVRLLNGVLRPDAGVARVLGFDPAVDGDEVRRRTGVLTENAGLDDRLTTRENLEFTARVRGFDAGDARRRVDHLIERFGLAERADDLTQGFSTGQRKRVALARALLHDPEVLFLDEPTSGLDPAGTRDVVELIRGLAEEGRTIILATHFLGEAGRLADRMAVLHRGRLRAFGAPGELAAGIWDGIGAHLDLGGPAGAEALDALGRVPGVLAASPAPDGAALRVRDREVVPVVVAAMVAREITVFGAAALPPTLEDVYFEIERRILAETGDRDAVDGFSDRYRGADAP
jgi:ABC-2 type transport system ATP-binding protein